MDVKSAFLYGTIDEEVYVMQPPGFQDLEFPTRVYKVEKAMYGAWYDIRSANTPIDKENPWGKDGTDIRSANTPIDKENPWGKDGTGKDVDLHLYRSMIGSLMYLIASRPNIMFAVCACARHQIVDYGGATQDRKSTTEGYQFLGRRLISWQCKKQTIMATSTTKAEYVAAASGCGQLLRHFIRDCFENNLISVDHVHTDDNVADLLTKLFDAGRFQYLVIVDFVEASHIRYALTINPTVYVSYIRQFWSTARIETTDEITKILATVDGKLMTIFESSIRRNLKLNDEEGISTLPDAELYEN
nr:hypothetical protein [Tanacetum cinerariifolium]